VTYDDAPALESVDRSADEADFAILHTKPGATGLRILPFEEGRARMSEPTRTGRGPGAV
jgi:hypothetical protein